MSLPDGWFTDRDTEVYSKLLSKLKDNSSIAELGVWKGRSLCSVAPIIKRKNLKVTAIDTFKGTENEPLHKEAEINDLEVVFRENLREHGIEAEVIKATTIEASKLFTWGRVNKQFDFIFIDADHTTRALIDDILAYLPLLKPNGIMAGHDYTWDTVRLALKVLNLPVESDGEIWWFNKSKYYL